MCVLALVHSLEVTIEALKQGNILPPHVAHERIKRMYSWDNVAMRTEKVSNFFCYWTVQNSKSFWFLGLWLKQRLQGLVFTLIQLQSGQWSSLPAKPEFFTFSYCAWLWKEFWGNDHVTILVLLYIYRFTMLLPDNQMFHLMRD